MGRIVVADNPLRPDLYKLYDWTGPYCADDGTGFLNKQFPEGFPGSHRTFLNQKPLAVEDYDVSLGPEDELVLLIAPGAPVVAAVAAIAGALAASPVLAALAVAVVSTAVSYLFAPTAPKIDIAEPAEVSTKQAKGRSVYNLSVPTNQTRLGDAIPVSYGRNRVVPDYAAFPYSRYENQKQYVNILCCLGQGEYVVHEIYFADTKVSSLQPGVVEATVYGPEDHKKALGNIFNTSNVYENLLTSPEVRDQEITKVSTLGPFAVCGPEDTVKRIDLDFVAPQGLFAIFSDNSTEDQRVDITINFYPIDEQGDVLGPAITHFESFVEQTRTPWRKSIFYDVPSARYQVTVDKTSSLTGQGELSMDNLLWTGLKGFVDYKPGEVYGDVTLIALKVKATEGLAQDVLNRISVDCTRKLPSEGGSATTSAHAAFMDVWTNQTYGAAQDSSLIENTLQGSFNAIIDFQTSIWELLETIASKVAYRVIPRGSELVLLSEVPSTTPRLRFSEVTTGPGLIVDGSLRVVYSLGTRKEEDGVEIEYRDPVSYQPDYALYPASAIRPRRIRLIGCTDITEAEKRAEFLWKQEQYSRFVWSLDSELDALVLMPGDTIEITPKGQSPKLCVVSEVRHAGGNRSSVVAFEYDARAYS